MVFASSWMIYIFSVCVIKHITFYYSLSDIFLYQVSRHLKNLNDGATRPDIRRKADRLNLSVESLACHFKYWMLVGVTSESFRHGIPVMIPKSSRHSRAEAVSPHNDGSDSV